MALKVDTFTEASDTTLPIHISDSGLGWSSALPSFFLSIDSALDELKNTTGFFGFGIGLETISNADYFVEVSGKTGGTSVNDSFGCFVREVAGSPGSLDFYYGSISGDGKWQISLLNVDLSGFAGVPNSVTSLANGTISGFNSNTFYLLRLSIVGSNLTLSIDNSSVGSATNNTLTSPGFLGVAIGGLTGNGSFNTRITSLNSDLNILSVPANAFFRYQAKNKAFRYSGLSNVYRYATLNKTFRCKALSKNFRHKTLSKNFRYIAGK